MPAPKTRNYPPMSQSTFKRMKKQKEKHAKRKGVASVTWLDFLALYNHRPITKELIDEIAEEIEAIAGSASGQVADIIKKKIK